MSMLHLMNRRSALAAPRATLALLVAVLSCGAACAQPLNLLTNGSFEQNASFVERPDVPRVADLSGSVPTGWTRDSGDQAEYMTRSPTYLGVTLYNPADGNYFVGAHDGEWWQQTFATVAGTQYTLAYSSAYGSVWWTTLGSYYRPGVAPGQVTLTGNTLLATASVAGSAPAPAGATLVDSPFVWSRHTLTFVADSTATTLRFAGSTTVANGGFVFIDDVVVTSAVPEPQASWLFLLGGFALAAVGKRKNAARRD